MKKLFISQPMRGKTDEEILQERRHLLFRAKELVNADVELSDTFFTEEIPAGVNRPLWCLGKSLMAMATADVVYMEVGANEYRGCRLEKECALAYGVHLIEDGGDS